MKIGIDGLEGESKAGREAQSLSEVQVDHIRSKEIGVIDLSTPTE